MRLTKKELLFIRHVLEVELRLQQKTVDHIFNSPGWASSPGRQSAIDAHLKEQEKIQAILGKLPIPEEDDREAIHPADYHYYQGS